MQYTPNYNLITVEGSDVVNPLVQTNPNFTAIDAAMFANKQAVIGTATELTSGTVHGITRLNPDSNYFRFTATSNWNAGDTFTVDGVSVSAFTPEGKTLSQGCYVINSEVFAVLNGTRLTVFVDNGISLSDLTDAIITTPSDNEALVYENGSWSNKQLTGSNITYGSGTVADSLDTLTDAFIVRSFYHNYSIESSGSANWNPITEDDIGVAGYNPVGIISYSTNRNTVYVANLSPENNDYAIYMHNIHTVAVTGTFRYTVLYKKA